MPETWFASSPCADGLARGVGVPAAWARQGGAALILALLTVSLATILAAAVLEDFGFAYEVHAGRYEQTQSRQLALGAIDWSRNVLAEDQRTSSSDHLDEAWAIEIPPTPISEDATDGTIGGRIVDLSGRFNLNALLPSNRLRSTARLRAERLFALVLEDPVQAAMLVAQLQHYLDRGATDADRDARLARHRGRPLANAEELRRIPGFSADIIGRLMPHVTAVPENHPINANTATAEVLAAMVDGLELNAARVLVAERERLWYRNLGDFAARLGTELAAPGDGSIDVRSRYFLVSVQASHGHSITRLEALLDREQTWPTILWYRNR